MTIQNSTVEDIPEIFERYRIATEYQKIKFPGNLWPEFDKALIQTEVLENRQWKIVINNKIACIWAITFNDPQIWEDRDVDPAIYIHRIASNPDFRGQNLVLEIVGWAREYARLKNKQFIRMDTCGDNRRLINHYCNCGFEFLGMKKLKNADDLPSHYWDADVCFFEIKLAGDGGL